MILITGATGNNGVELIKQLSGRGVPLRAFVRNRAPPKQLACQESKSSKAISPILKPSRLHWKEWNGCFC
jgi:short-subunit dehydrogenase